MLTVGVLLGACGVRSESDLAGHKSSAVEKIIIDLIVGISRYGTMPEAKIFWQKRERRRQVKDER